MEPGIETPSSGETTVACRLKSAFRVSAKFCTVPASSGPNGTDAVATSVNVAPLPLSIV